SPTTTAPQVNTETILGDPNSGDGLIVENLSTTVPPIMASLTAEDRDALTSYLAEADDDRNHVEFLATLSQPRADDPVPRLAINEEGRAARPPFTSGTLEAPLRLRSSSAITSAGMLLFAFGAGDEAQSQSVEEALAAFEAFLGQNLAADQLDLVLAPGAPLPADFLARAIGRAHVNLARFTRVTVHLQSAAAQAQAPWTWPLKSRLIDVQLNGNARGAVFPWAQLQVLRISAAVKAVETAAFLVNLPQLRVLSLSLGFVGPKKTKYKRTRLPRLEKLELQAKVDPAVFLRRVHLPALRVLGLHLDIAPQGGGDKVDYGDRLLKCSILWNALQDVQLSGPSVGPTTLFLLHRLFDNEDPAIQTRCRLSRGQ
ncbi:uncharacterized protein SCHCODRAFT_02496267, partial [Schizophyllum commune H4-8]|uniref:uncharacterized protein n=1 Tax=Schizophyllum commune (strain H4-8 / FGSC 9210) TaxID=578458 RepID=UPI00215E993F